MLIVSLSCVQSAVLQDPDQEASEALLEVVRSWNKKFPSGINQFWFHIAEPGVYVRHPDVAKIIFKTAGT